MSFSPSKFPFSPLKKTFEAAPDTFTLPPVLPTEVAALKALLVAQQNAHFAVVQDLHHQAQAIQQEALVQTAKANGLEPYTWLRRLLRDLPTAQTVEGVGG